jgi:hypothetical protein
MLDPIRKRVAVQVMRRRVSLLPQVPAKVLVSGATLASFSWLLAHDMVQPIVIYALQLYLSF